MNLYESIKKNLKEAEDNLKVIKEPGVGAIVEDSNGKRYYQAGSTSQGYVFKDLDAYENDRDAVCYICEGGFDDYPDGLIPVEDLTDEGLAKAIRYGSVDTHNSIIEDLKRYWNYIEEPIKEEFLEQAAEFIFDTVDWQSTNALINEVDWDGYVEDTKGEDFEEQIEVKEAVCKKGWQTVKNEINESQKLNEHTDSWLTNTDPTNHRVKPFVDFFKKQYPDKQIDKLWLEGIEGGWEPCVAFIESDGTVYRIYLDELNDGIYMSHPSGIKIVSNNFKKDYDYVD